MEKELYRAHPAMFRNHPVSFILTLILCLVGVGLIIFLVWWLKHLGTTLIITENRTILRKGILARNTNEVLHENIRNIQINQSFLQRIFNVGDIGIASAGQSDVEIQVKGIPGPREVKQLIDQYRDL